MLRFAPLNATYHPRVRRHAPPILIVLCCLHLEDSPDFFSIQALFFDPGTPVTLVDYSVTGSWCQMTVVDGGFEEGRKLCKGSV